MSPTPRKPTKPTVPEAKGRTPLQRVLDADGPCQPRADVVVRFDGAAPSEKALKALGADGERIAALSEHLTKHGGRIAEQLAADRDLAALLATDPAAAMERLKIPAELVKVEGGSRAEFLDRFGGIRFEIPVDEPPSRLPDAGAVPAASTALIQLLSDTFALAAADPAQDTTLHADPHAVVAAAAAAHPPAGVTDAAAVASLVNQATASIRGALGIGGSTPGSSGPILELDPSKFIARERAIRIPTPRGI